MNLDEIELSIGLILEKGRNEGLERSDCNHIRKLYENLIKLNLQEEDRWHKDVTILYNILKEYKKSGIFTGFHMDTDYILKNAFILPLVMANNSEAIRVEEEKVYFYSQFAHDNKGLMFVNVRTNEVKCKKSGKHYQNIPYLQNIESLSRMEAPLLMCYIFNYRIPKHTKELMEKSQKYKKIITSSEYKELLYRIFTKSDPLLHSKLNEIIRIENDIYDENFKCTEVPNRLYLK